MRRLVALLAALVMVASMGVGVASAAKLSPTAVLTGGPCVPTDQRFFDYGWDQVRGVTRLSLYWDFGTGEREYNRFDYTGRQPLSHLERFQYNTTQASTFRVEVYYNHGKSVLEVSRSFPSETC